MAEITDLIREIERLRLAPDELLIVRVKSLLSAEEMQQLHRNLSKVAEGLGWTNGPDRIVIVDSDISLTVVKAEQEALGV